MQDNTQSKFMGIATEPLYSFAYDTGYERHLTHIFPISETFHKPAFKKAAGGHTSTQCQGFKTRNSKYPVLGQNWVFVAVLSICGH